MENYEAMPRIPHSGVQQHNQNPVYQSNVQPAQRRPSRPIQQKSRPIEQKNTNKQVATLPPPPSKTVTFLKVNAPLIIAGLIIVVLIMIIVYLTLFKNSEKPKPQMHPAAMGSNKPHPQQQPQQTRQQPQQPRPNNINNTQRAAAAKQQKDEISSFANMSFPSKPKLAPIEEEEEELSEPEIEIVIETPELIDDDLSDPDDLDDDFINEHDEKLFDETRIDNQFRTIVKVSRQGAALMEFNSDNEILENGYTPTTVKKCCDKTKKLHKNARFMYKDEM